VEVLLGCREAVAEKDEGAGEIAGKAFAREECDFLEEDKGSFANGDGGLRGVELDLVHGDALEVGGLACSGFTDGFEAVGLEALGDESGGALVGFGAGVAAFHGVVGEIGGLGPPGGGGWGGLIDGRRGALGEERRGKSQGEGDGKNGGEASRHSCLLTDRVIVVCGG